MFSFYLNVCSICGCALTVRFVLRYQLLQKAGAESRQTVFLFNDSQIKDEAFMEDISMILNTGDVPNLYAADEKAEIIEKMQNIARTEVRWKFMTDLFLLENEKRNCHGEMGCWMSFAVTSIL